MQISTVTVIGANGTMGANISAIFASFGGAKVFMVSRDMEKSKKAAIKACNSVRSDAIANKLIPADYSMLSSCVAHSDLVFECVAEDIEIKLDIAKRVASCIPEQSFSCFGTSGLSVKKLAEMYPEKVRENCFGVHMFNPPYNMTLCELTPTEYTNSEKMEELRSYLSNVLFRTVVEVKDIPAFLGNRIGFQFINEAMQYAEQYKDNGGIDYIDAILGSYTGRSMSPITTADFVGLDIHKAIVDNLYENTNDYAHETFVMPAYAQKLIDDGKLGRKTRGGLYKLVAHENGLKQMLVYDIASQTYREKIKYAFPYAEKMIADIKVGDYQPAFQTLVENYSIEAKICLEFLLKYVIYSLSATEEVGYDSHSADDVMATGFNWCPPLAVIEALSTVADFKSLVFERLDPEMLKQVDIDHLLQRAEPSKYDYRKYFKSAR